MKATITKDILFYKKYFNYLKDNFNFSRLGKTFTTSNNKYFYDTGTGKVLQCTDNVYKILNYLEMDLPFEDLDKIGLNEGEILSALSEVEDAVQEEKILSAPPVTSFGGPNTNKEDLNRYIEEGLEQICLEVTECCNLRCDYCVYGSSNDIFRSFGEKSMTFETAKKAIDYAAKHSKGDVILSFYGGEPLLRFDLIKKCVDYSREIIKDRKISYAMTTNLVLMSKEYAEYIASVENFLITCSIDGGKEIHDEHRKLVSGEGSFNKAFLGLKNLVEALGDEAESRMTFSMVINPPYSEEKFDEIQNFFDSLEWLPPFISKSVTYVQTERSKKEKVVKLEEFSDEEVDPLGVWTRSNMKGMNKIEENKLFSAANMDKALLRIHKRRLCEVPMQNYVFNACCVPGSRRLYVTAEGKFKVCERIGESPFIGDVDNGIDIDSITKNYVNDYMNESIEYCKNCWAVHLCNVCYTECYEKSGINLEGKHQLCESTRYSQKKALEYYYELLENDPQSLSRFNEMDIK